MTPLYKAIGDPGSFCPSSPCTAPGRRVHVLASRWLRTRRLVAPSSPDSGCYDRKELRKRLNLEEWILEQLTRLYDCQEEEIPELEIDVDELLDMESDDTRAARVKELLVDCYKPTEAFISGLLDKIRGMQKLSTPQKK
ncbi:protein phosphatase 1 regulatory subunit 14B [Echinops telfairi]|uniref:Protein phosphatase 1 regulatory subunit 14 n=1 Tax=Echinops telfairi TaxID=9371 RepID=A0ABM0J323_ECHTE|nr:protein phosphatase 1 regulatory subunit 14B [Echinops telfairi]